jgi:hypothetical protein
MSCKEVRYLWYRNGVFMPGNEYKTVIIVADSINEPGLFTVRMICDRCYSPLPAQPVFYQPVSTGTIITKGELKVYPNPLHGQELTIELPENIENGKIYVYDVLGKLILQSELNSGGNHILDASTWSAGVYNIIFRTSDMQFQTKVIRQ